MRRSLSFSCQGSELVGSLDSGSAATGILIVTGGSEIRSGAHGGLAQLAAWLSEADYPVFRFERRGVGDSEGEDRGFAGCAEDLVAARRAFVTAAPHVERVIGIGHCDGATALALHQAHLDLAGMMLVNPWVIEPSTGLPPPAAIKHRYAARLKSVDGWKRLLSGSIDYRKAVRGVLSIAGRAPAASLAQRIAESFTAASPPVTLILARHDATALAFLDAWRRPAFQRLRHTVSTRVVEVDSRSHSFARQDEPDRLAQLCLTAIKQMEAPPRR